MKIFLMYKGVSHPWNIRDGMTISDLKEEVRKKFGLDPQQNIKILHSGANLLDQWIILDVGIPYGSSLHCKLREQEPIPNLHVACNFNGDRIDLFNVDVTTITVFELQELVMQKTGLPLGSFRLTDEYNREMFSKKTCTFYDVLPGSTVQIQVWRGWAELINAAAEGNFSRIKELLDEDKAVKFYQQKVIMFIAAFYGLLELAEDMLNSGVRADEPVGYHPGKKWCSDSDDPTIHLYAIHMATERNNLEIVRLLMNRFPNSIIVQNYRRQDALAIAKQHGHRECVAHISTKHTKPPFTVQHLVGQPEDLDFDYRNHLLMAKIKQWHAIGKDRISLFTKRGATANGLNMKALDVRGSHTLPSKSDKAFHIDGLIHYRCRTCPARLAERPISSLSDRTQLQTPKTKGRIWTPSAKSRRTKAEVISNGLHWDISKQKSNKIEFTDLLFTPNSSSELPELPSSYELVKKEATQSPPPTDEEYPKDGSKTPVISKTPNSPPVVSVPKTPTIPKIHVSATTTTTSSHDKTVAPPSRKPTTRKRIQAIGDYSTSMWVHNGLTSKEKATACLDMSKSYTNKTWMARFRIAMSVNESTLKRKLKEGAPLQPVARNKQGRLYSKQFHSPKPKTTGNNFAARWKSDVITSEAVVKEQSAAFRSRGLSVIKDKIIPVGA